MNYCVFDLETTGLDIRGDEPIQIYFGISKSLRSRITTELLLHTYSAVRPTVGAVNVHHLSYEKLKEIGVPAKTAVSQVLSFMWEFQPLAFIGHNCLNFDFPMLQNWLQRYGTGPFRHAPSCIIYDTMHLAGLIMNTKKWIKLADAAKYFKVPIEGELHNARTDGRITWGLFQALMDKEGEDKWRE